MFSEAPELNNSGYIPSKSFITLSVVSLLLFNFAKVELVLGDYVIGVTSSTP